MQRFYLHISFVFFLLLHLSVHSQVRSEIDFNKGWKFYLGDDSLAKEPIYNDSKWRKLSLPHDWSIESDFIKDAPATNQGGSLPGGVGWYRKTFTLPSSATNKNVSIAFDAVYKNSEVWINGHYLGKRPNGYVAFSYDLTDYVHPAPQKNVIAVKVDNSQQPDSRWYSGSGIYRNVKLFIRSKIVVNAYGIFVTTSEVTNGYATIEITTSMSDNFTQRQPFSIVHTILDNQGLEVAKQKPYNFNFYGPGTALIQKLKVKNPVLWSVDRPHLYILRTQLLKNGKVVDQAENVFGIRTYNFDPQKGFFLNNKSLKINGVCMHHDLGALGAAFNINAARRQLKMLKEMGCNAIRFSHNPPASEMLDLCDQMGFLVIVEAFDMWQKRKNKYDYHLDFKEWHKKDLEAIVLRDRNHPSVIMWSIGNEIREQFDSTGTTITEELVSIIKSLDNSRPVTTALTETFPEKNFITRANAVDVLGFNYKDYDYAELPKRFPGQKFIASETASALETRGVYEFPSDRIRIWPPDYKAQDTFSANKDFTCAAYDNTRAYWGNTHERSWLAVKNNQHIAGAFVWSGFDYLGEPIPYPKFPARSSYYGIIDLAGFPKDVYYMYQSEWSTKNVLHIFPHWNWKTGDTVDVWAYYNNADEVELFLNGRSAGIRKKNDTTLHVIWRLPFQPGTLKAISKRNGKIVLTKELKTSGEAARIELAVDKKNLKADGKDLSFITARILDKNGVLVPTADNEIKFSVTGSGAFAGSDNGYQADTITLKSAKRKCWKGMALAIIQSTEKKGNITLTAISPGISSASVSIRNN
ncbi:MAG TPA: glycoside hydrolase family 2 TIM barrel-domain containing protein [Chitinophagaceae bacterium]|nr:glycoside hydrolase family 2 TIM barrel-domain containing protein [Chitinophagaceae bacterium]